MPRPELDLVLLDLDGTITDSEPGIVASYRHTLDLLGLEVDEAALRRCVGPPIRDSLALLGVPPAQLEEALAAYRGYFVPHGIFDNRLYDGAVAMLTRVREAGLPIGLATSKLREYAVDILEHFEIAGFFESVCGATRDGRLSHKDDIVAEALLAAGISGSDRVVMVGDREHDICGARANGVVPVGAAWGYGSRSELEAAGARLIVDSPADLGDAIVTWGHAG